MLNAFLFIGLPYIALVICVVGSIYRYKSHCYSYSALSSQFLESSKLKWGSMSWHIGLLIVILIHLLPFLMPGPWSRMVSSPFALAAVEALGLTGALLSVFGLSALILRRILNPYVQAVTTMMDLTILALFLGQVAIGIAIAVKHRWGAQWAPHTTTPYLWSLLMLRPDMSYVADMPWLVKAHIVGAWLILLCIPFSRLVHIFSLPIEYLFRRPQRVLWANPRRVEAQAAQGPAMESRRHFLLGVSGVLAGSALLSVGVTEKVVRFYRGPGLSREEEARLLETNLKRLKMTAEEKQLELERMRQEFIQVARLSELDAKRGKYFIDYEMRPALAFLGADGLPILISAKCTHLGCTVQADMNAEGRILCPCHVSWFDVKTGTPNAGSPAKTPLPLLGWVIMDENNEVAASKTPGGTVNGSIDAGALAGYRLFISKEHSEGSRES
jgi:nitrate reductase gamma subunit